MMSMCGPVAFHRQSGTTTTHSTQSTASVRCWGTKWSLLWGSRFRRLRPTLRSGTGLGKQEVTEDCWCLILHIGEVWRTWRVTVLQQGVRAAGVFPADSGNAADKEGCPAEQQAAGPTGPRWRCHHYGCQVWAVSFIINGMIRLVPLHVSFELCDSVVFSYWLSEYQDLLKLLFPGYFICIDRWCIHTSICSNFAFTTGTTMSG